MSQHGPALRPSLLILISAAAWFAASASTVRAADECIVKPTSAAPQGQHWYYQTHGDSKRQCWHLGPDRAAVPRSTAEASNPPKPHTPVATRALDAAELTQQQREALFRKYVAWRRAHSEQDAQ